MYTNIHDYAQTLRHVFTLSNFEPKSRVLHPKHKVLHKRARQFTLMHIVHSNMAALITET